MDYFDQINAYVSGEMTSEERAIFETEMDQNEQLKQDVETEQLLVEGVIAASLRQEMKNINVHETKEQNEPKIIKLGQWRQLAVAASVAALLGVFMWQYNSSPSSSVDAFASSYQVDPGLPVTMGEQTELAFNEAMVAYKNDELDRAQREFDQLCKTENVDKACFFSAMVSIQKEEYQLAENQLSTLLANEPVNGLAQRAEWHLAYVQHQLDNEKYIQLLKRIANTNGHPFQKEAKKILGE